MAIGDYTQTASTGAWMSWNYYYLDNGTTASTWYGWNQQFINSTSGGTNTWDIWNGNLTSGFQGQVAYQPRELTPEEHAAQTERLRVAAEQARIAQEAARLAAERAEALLRAHLDEEQQMTLDREHAFLVSVKSGRKYKVNRGQQGNVKELDEHGHEVRSFCIHPADVPDQDAMLAQKLLLEHDEPAFRRIANITELRRTA